MYETHIIVTLSCYRSEEQEWDVLVLSTQVKFVFLTRIQMLFQQHKVLSIYTPRFITIADVYQMLLALPMKKTMGDII